MDRRVYTSCDDNIPMNNSVLILDFGSQVTQLIARRVRELQVYCEIFPHDVNLENIKAFDPAGIILSGGPSSVENTVHPRVDSGVWELGIPILGICYGMQLINVQFGGEVGLSEHREYGKTAIRVKKAKGIFSCFDAEEEVAVWMSHGDSLDSIAPEFETLASSENAPIVAIQHKTLPIAGVQFHPEVHHTPRGKEIFHRFVRDVCNVSPSWTMGNFIAEQCKIIREQAHTGKIICGLSGGVDSSVVAALVHRAVPEKLVCILVDHGLMRKNEAFEVQKVFEKHFGVSLVVVDAKERFFSTLKGITDPQEKRTIIRQLFVDVFHAEAKKIENVAYFAQGTLYPDVIESQHVRGPSATIKNHHNVGISDILNLELIEPLRELFKDEVRKLGAELDLPEGMLNRHPFPGPGLAVRILGDVTEERADLLREADAIFMQELESSGYYDQVWQAFCVFLPVRSVGVMGDGRTYEHVIALRAVESVDAMTADWAPLPHSLLGHIANRIINEVNGVNRVVYDISSKPPATIEWE